MKVSISLDDANEENSKNNGNANAEEVEREILSFGHDDLVWYGVFAVFACVRAITRFWWINQSWEVEKISCFI